jgi:hypothetical protein
MDVMVVKREKLPAPAGTRNPDHPARIPASYHWEDKHYTVLKSKTYTAI